MKNWQRTQTKICERLGAKETGKPGKSAPDGIHPYFVVETKHKKTLPNWIVSALVQAKKYAKDNHIDKPPLAIIKEKGKHTKHALVFMWLEDFEDAMGDTEWDGLGVA